VIAVDTNVLLRHLLDDDPEQSPKAHKLIEANEQVLITDVVLVETIWTLKGKKYKAGKDDIVTLVSNLLSEPNIEFESAQTVWRALNDFRKAKSVKVSGKNKEADFSDALIVHKAQFTADLQNTKLQTVYTFDVAAQALPGSSPA
jgi:predicted nucleic-acid-binding protein